MLTEAQTRNFQKMLASLSVAVCLYFPFAWIIFLDYPWNQYRLYWLKIWPVLPGLLPATWIYSDGDRFEPFAMGMFTALPLVVLAMLSWRSRKHWAAAVVSSLFVSIPTAYIAYCAFYFHGNPE